MEEPSMTLIYKTKNKYPYICVQNNSFSSFSLRRMSGKEKNIDPIEQYVIDYVRKKRSIEGLSQQKLAIDLGVSKGFISSVESNNYPAKYNLRHLNILAKIFKCSPKDFLPEESL